MAAIDKIYLNYNNTKELLDWVRKYDKLFVEEFKESNCPSMLEFFYITSNNIEEAFSSGRDTEHPVCNIPVLVELWMLKQDIPEAVRKELYLNYGLKGKSEEEIQEFINRPLEEDDTRKQGNHLKIIYRSGHLHHRNKANLWVDSYSYVYYTDKLCMKYRVSRNDIVRNNIKSDDYTESLLNDFYWYCEETKAIENILFRRKKNIYTSKISILSTGTSIKSIIRKLRKNKFPVGTVFKVFDPRYDGDIIIIVTR